MMNGRTKGTTDKFEVLNSRFDRNPMLEAPNEHCRRQEQTLI